MTGTFTTRWATVIILGEGRMRIHSDGILDCGEWTGADLKKAIEQLKEQGWTLVGSVDRRVGSQAVEGMDLFFRANREHLSS
jgi:hypothetical protein